jgi:hypothetical protein
MAAVSDPARATPVRLLFAGTERRMDPTNRFIVGVLLMLAIELLVGSTAVFVVRRRKRIAPVWSWLKTLRAVFLLMLLVIGVSLVPVVGPFAAMIVSLIGLKRLSGLDILSAFILSFCLGVLIFAVATVLSRQLQIDLLGLRH